MIWLRAAVATAIALVLAALAGRVFDGFEPELLVGALVPMVVVVAAGARRWNRPARVAVALVTIVVSVVLGVLLAGGDLPADAVDGLTVGPRRLLSTDWPSPWRPDLVGAVTAAIATCTAASALLLGGRRWRLAPLLPFVVEFVAISAASAPAGSTAVWLLPLGALAGFFATLEPGRPLGERLRFVAGQRQLVVLSSVAAGLALAVSVPITLSHRDDPRTAEPPTESRAVVDPIEAVIALRALDPPVELYRIEPTGAFPTRWRTAALATYDGQRWTPGLTLRPIGRRLGPDAPGAVHVEIEFLTDIVDLVPIPGHPITVDADVLTDDARTLVRLVDPPTPGDVLDVTARPDPTRAAVTDVQIGTRPVGEISAAFTGVADTLAGTGTLLDRLTNIERTMREEFVLDSGAPGGGLQRALIERFLSETRRGTPEQFVTSFVILARALGVDARVATGFAVPAEVVDAGGPVVVTSAAAAVWPEVAVEGGGWVAFDPVPAEETAEDVAPPPPREAQSPSAVQPPVPPPAERDTPEPEEQPEAVVEDEGRWSDVAELVGRIVGATLLVLLPFVAAVVAILLVKRRRRRRRLIAGSPTDRIRGAWAVATDSLVDAGMTIRLAWTDHEIADAGVPLAPDAGHEIHRLGRLSSMATFGGLGPAGGLEVTLLADDAAMSVRRVEDAIAATLGRLQRWRWRLSLRSIRGHTRSPVLGDVGRH